MDLYTRIKIGGLDLKNPVMTASGTFGYGPEFEDFIDINRLDGIVVKELPCIIVKVMHIHEWLKHHREC